MLHGRSCFSLLRYRTLFRGQWSVLCSLDWASSVMLTRSVQRVFCLTVNVFATITVNGGISINVPTWSGLNTCQWLQAVLAKLQQSIYFNIGLTQLHGHNAFATIYFQYHQDKTKCCSETDYQYTGISLVIGSSQMLHGRSCFSLLRYRTLFRGQWSVLCSLDWASSVMLTRSVQRV